MRGPSTIYLVRHGECKANVEQMNLSPEIDKITDKGILQSQLLGRALQDVQFTKAYSSTYPRAVDTAHEVLSQLKGPKPELQMDERIREREMGEFENRPMNDVFKALFTAAKEEGIRMVDFEVPGGESVQNLEDRIASFWEDILKLIRESDKPQTILVVTHGVIIIRSMLKLRYWSKEPSRALIFNSFSLQRAITPTKNTAYHVLTGDASTEENGTPKTVINITKFHESGHLEPLKPKVPAPPNKEVEEITKTWMELVDQQCTTV